MSNSDENINDVIIVGSGPAGLTAAIYTARADLKPIVFAGEIWGGQLMNTSEIENFPGFPEGIEGPVLMENMLKQAQKFGAEVIFKSVDFIDLEGDIKTVKAGGQEYKAESVILAMGSTPKKLEIPGENEFYGRGVSTCATCDAAFYRDRVVAVVGGGDSAMEEATFLTRFAKKVYLIHRRDSFRASPIMAKRAADNEKIEILFNTEIREIVGDEKVQKIKIFNNKDNSESEIELDGVFLAIGHIPVTGFLKDKLSLNEMGYVEAIDEIKTNVEGVFVAGEVQDHEYKQAITTAAAGCKAALEAQHYLEAREDK